MKEIKLNSEVCLSPGNCYKIKTDVPLWLLVLLAGSSIFLVKELYQSFTK